MLGKRLIDRSTKHATLTPAGDALLPEAIRLLQLAEEAATTQPDISVEFRRIPDVDEPGEVGTGSSDIGVTNSDPGGIAAGVPARPASLQWGSAS